MPCQPLPKSPTSTVRLAGLTLYPAETDASRRGAERVVNENRQAAARFAFGHAAVSPDVAIAAIEAGIMVPQPCQQQQGAARRSISWRAAEVDLRADRTNTRPNYRLKWVLSRGAWLAYLPARSGPPTELRGMVRTGGRTGAVAIQFLYGGFPFEVATFPMDPPGLQAAKLALEARVAEDQAA